MGIIEDMIQERIQLERIVDNAELKTKENAIEYAKSITKLIWNHNMLGMIYQYYDENVIYKGPSGLELNNSHDVVLEILGMQAAFPDLRVFVTEEFASGNENDGFKVYLRSYCTGTNKGPSKYGQPTGNILDENNSLGQTVYVIKKVRNQWKIVNEYSIRSEMYIDKLLKDEL